MQGTVLHTADSPALDTLSGVASQVSRLQDLLDAEFEALKQRKLEAFEDLQAEKTALLEALSLVARSVADLDPAPAAWLAEQDALQACKQAHLRNTQLLQRQLHAVRGALQALQGENEVSVDLYDRMGQISRRGAAWSQHLA